MYLGKRMENNPISPMNDWQCYYFINIIWQWHDVPNGNDCERVINRDVFPVENKTSK